MRKIFWCTQELIDILAVHCAHYLSRPGSWIINIKYLQLKRENIMSFIPEPAALCMYGFAMFMLFSSLLTSHQAAIQHSIIGADQYDALVGRQPVTIQKQKLRENVIICFSTINHPITSKLKSLNYSFIFMLTITAKFFSIKTDKVTWTTKKMRNFSKMAKAV